MYDSGINKGTCTHNYHSAICLLLIDFTYLEGKDDEIVAKELAAVYSHSNRVSSNGFKKPYNLEELSLFNVRMNEAIEHWCNWNDGNIPHSELETVLHREASSAVAIYCIGLLKTECNHGPIDRTVIDITHLGRPQIADINLYAICRTFAFHNNSKHVCALRSAYSVAQWLNVYTISLQYVNCPAQPAYH